MTDRVIIEERNLEFPNEIKTFSVLNNGHNEVSEFFKDAYIHFESIVAPLRNTFFLFKIGSSFFVKCSEHLPSEQGRATNVQDIQLTTISEIVDFQTDLIAFYNDYIVSALNEQMIGFSVIQIVELNIRISSFDPNIEMADRVHVEERNFAFQNRLQTFSIVNDSHTAVLEFFNDAYEEFKLRVKPVIETNLLIKIGASFCARFEKRIQTEQGERTESQNMYLNTKAEIVDFETDLREFYDEYIVRSMNRKIDDVQLRGSGFSLAEILELNIQLSSFDPCSGSSYIKTPKFLENKKAIVNVQNRDNECFKYAILSALYPATKDAQRVKKYMPYKKSLDFLGIKFPVGLDQITKFELQNPSISINVYMFDQKNKKIRPLRLTKNVKEKHVHLLLLTEQLDEDEDEFDENDVNEGLNIFKYSEQKMHYCWIKNLSALLCSQLPNHCSKKLICDRCLNYFWNERKLKEHKVYCDMQNECQIRMPSFNNCVLEFDLKKYKKQLKVPFIIYADIESVLKKVDIPFSKNINAYQQHDVLSVGFYFHCSYDETQSFYKEQRGPECIEWFVQELHQIAQKVGDIMEKPAPLNMSLEDEAFFIVSDDCHICNEIFISEEEKVRDHSHITGEYRGAAHNRCNLNYQEARFIPVVFHNLTNYDAHFIIKQLANHSPGKVNIIPCNDEKYISFTKVIPNTCGDDFGKSIQLRFIDSFRFMASSLDYLSSLLPAQEKKILQSVCKELTPEQIQLLQRKGVFCYDYIDSLDRLNETTLPSKEMFYNKLNDNHITDAEYEFAKKVWNTFKIKTLGDYSDLYMKTDILLLADVFENFRQTCYNIYKLDPAHYYTAPGLSFDAMLKYTKVKIDLFTDIDMLLFIERGIRGGISQCSKRYSKANHKYMIDYDSTQDTKYLVYLDANNLYGNSMMQYLPLEDFAWAPPDFNTITAQEILLLPDDSSTGYIFEVDLEYPKEIHNYHKDYPFCAENKFVPFTKEKKLLLTLFDKKNYVIHYRMLKCALRAGLILKKVHKILKFTQSQWLKPYIDLNTMLRTNATNEFEKSFFKWLINAIYGKTLENIRSRVDIRLLTYWDGRYGAKKETSKPNFKRFTIFDENLVAVELKKTHILMDKPNVIGMAILDLSKLLMYEFYYDHLKSKYGENVEMAYTDTDSFILEVKTDCFYSDMRENLHRYDTSDYPEDNRYKIMRVNKKVPGLFKDELNGKIMSEFVGLRSKMYSFKVDGEEKKRAKGVKKCVLTKTLSFQDYMKCIQENCEIVRSQNTIRSKKHQVFSITQSKIALSPSDNKRYILDGNINTLPWGHFDVCMHSAEMNEAKRREVVQRRKLK